MARKRGDCVGAIFRELGGRVIEPSVEHYAEPCSICGGKSDAYWSGKQTITVCYTCATQVLPCLIADAMRALHFGGRDTHQLVKTNEWMNSRFWRAAALALSKETPTKEDVDRRIAEENEVMEQLGYKVSRNGERA
jgi:hypothetical protein